MTGAAPARALRHGSAMVRSDAAVPGAPGARFGRMFGHLPVRDPGADARRALVELAAAGSSTPNPRIPAGFTYLGQFIDHDLTFDATSRLDRDNDPGTLANLRTPRLDLDSVYGAGPRDQPYLYEWSDLVDRGVMLLPNPPPGHRGHLDLPRNAQGLALIGDPRNDENRIVSQLHLLFIAFHNRVVRHLRDGGSPLQGHDVFEEARRIVRWHYQWIVAHDFMERVTGPVAAQVLVPAAGGRPPTVRLRHFTSHGQPRIPVEFSGAAFRFGHSMVRADYRLAPGAAPVPLFRADPEPDPEHPRPSLAGFRPLPAALQIDWDLFFFDEPDFERTNSSQRINGRLSAPLAAVPPEGESLADLNLRRGRALGLPSGRDVARLMGARELTPAELRLDASTLGAGVATALHEATPLWWYILCEAATSDLGDGGQHLGPVGGRIVAEVLVGLLAADPQSYLRQWPTWTPRELPSAAAGDFTMLDLVSFVLGRAPRPQPAAPGA